MLHRVVTHSAALTLRFGCTTSSLTKKEIQRQNHTGGAAISVGLFEHGLDTAASRRVRNNGSVIIKFDHSMAAPTHTAVVEELRANANTPSVRAEQSGVEECPLKH